MLQSHLRENPGAATPGLEGHTKNSHPENNNLNTDAQLILRDGLWEFASIFTACGVSAMALAGGGSIGEIEAALTSARLALIEAIGAFKELRSIEEAQ
jgi:hypothetical protein